MQHFPDNQEIILRCSGCNKIIFQKFLTKYLKKENLTKTKKVVCCERAHTFTFNTFKVKCVKEFEELLYKSVFPFIPLVSRGSFESEGLDSDTIKVEGGDKDNDNGSDGKVIKKGIKEVKEIRHRSKYDSDSESEDETVYTNRRSHKTPKFYIPDTPTFLCYASKKIEGRAIVISIQHTSCPDELLGMDNILKELWKEKDKIFVSILIAFFSFLICCLLFLEVDPKKFPSITIIQQEPNILIPVCYTNPSWSDDFFQLGYSGLEQCCFRGDTICDTLKNGLGSPSVRKNACLLKQDSDKSKSKSNQFVEAYKGQCRFEKANGKPGSGIEGVIVKT